jgi:hypothetical protein
MIFGESECPRTFKRGVSAPLYQKHANIARKAERVKLESSEVGYPRRKGG